MHLRTGFVAALCLFLAGPGQAALEGRMEIRTGYFQAWYDPVLDVTWLANANLAQTNSFGLPVSNLVNPPDGSISFTGRMNWATANLWIEAMNEAKFLGVDRWRMPVVRPVDGVEFDYAFRHDGSADQGYNISAPGTVHAGSTGSEMAHMYYNTLGNLAWCDPGFETSCVLQPGGGFLQNRGPFETLQAFNYWSGTEYEPVPSNAWRFGFQLGPQLAANKDLSFHVWAVMDGDIALIPLPPAAWLFAAALGLLAGIRRSRSQRS